MNAVLVLGDEDDCRGYRLAGVDAIVCQSADDVARALRSLDNRSLLLVSEPVSRLAPTLLAAQAAAGTIVTVLPPTGAGR